MIKTETTVKKQAEKMATTKSRRANETILRCDDDDEDIVDRLRRRCFSGDGSSAGDTAAAALVGTPCTAESGFVVRRDDDGRLPLSISIVDAAVLPLR
jgi:hypothetical protein